MATWAKGDLLRRKETGVSTNTKADLGRDPEALALIPPPRTKKQSAAPSSSDESWHVMRTPPKKKGAAEMTESDIVEEDESAEEQIRALEGQISALKKRQSKA